MVISRLIRIKILVQRQAGGACSMAARVDRTHPVFSLESLRAACSTCGLVELCLPLGLSAAEIGRIDAIVRRRRKVRKNEALYHAGAVCRALYAVRVGFFKTRDPESSGSCRVFGFHMAGELLGLDGIAGGSHTCEAVALEDSEVCEVSFEDLEVLSRELPALQKRFHQILSREIQRDHQIMRLLTCKTAEQRLAVFLLDLSERYHSRGYSPSSFHLRMSREEIGSYLGLQLETVSRLFSNFRKRGLIEVDRRHLTLIDFPELQRIATDADPAESDASGFFAESGSSPRSRI